MDIGNSDLDIASRVRTPRTPVDRQIRWGREI